jgi:hypothetical protein
VIARTWPQLKEELGDAFESEYKIHALSSAKKFEDNALNDGKRFAKYLARKRFHQALSKPFQLLYRLSATIKTERQKKKEEERRGI